MIPQTTLYDSAASTGSEETVTTADSSDLNLLAAIIYCEAGNQSREGKVAVGAVVLNRVARFLPEQHFRGCLPGRTVHTGVQRSTGKCTGKRCTE